MRLALASPMALSLASTVLAASNFTEAPIITNSQQGVLYEATLFSKQNTSIRGVVTAWAPSNAIGVKFHVDFWGFPPDVRGPYPYHIHLDRVPQDGNCYSAGGHLDPYDRGEQPACDPNQPQTCQLGDLSGKHSPVYVAPNAQFEAEYTDLFLSTTKGSDAYIGNRSIVVHAPDGTRLNCGNFVLLEEVE
ncbi:hypothetical protein ASPZODRAFT_1026982 [Penicilliopsis zonata CBS 506.65]|uniref:superoxide dismutase n=1 Tax=Penicilliopsis zonata CBS 506.65 TaxID=1073090 RepID=A0A1L9SRT5_9EURO|nr:hypothetical protein ASPZODRAFT_1026982 [Penicilliopsis zonata CBS 506.65]OJJ49781.1 hypothetical protein ASPZODRAFT_1026982 [Penicilliopsis zonata CBS 506.65]